MSKTRWFYPFVIATVLLAVALPVFLMGYVSLISAEKEFAARDFAEASRQFQRAVRFHPWRTDLWEQAGLAEYASENYSAAVGFLNRAPELSEPGCLALGDSYYHLGDIESAQAAYQNGIRNFDSPHLYANLAIIYRDQKEWPAESEALEHQLRLDSTDAFAHYRLGLLYSFLDPELALPELRIASDINPEIASAVQTMTSALNLASTQDDLSFQMAAVGRGLGLVQDWELAKAAFEKAVQADEKNAEAWAWLGETKQQLGQDGAGELDRALSLDRTSPIVRGLRALYWNRQGKYEQMLAEYLLAAEFDPVNPVWQASIGDAYFKLGDLAAALAAYQKAAELGTNDATYWRLLANFCSDNGIRLDDIGLPAALKSVEIAPNNPDALDALGYAYYASGRYANAQQVLSDLIVRFPKYYSAYLHLAMINLTQGDRPAAYNNLTFVRDNDASGEYRTQAIELLGQYFP